MEMAQEKDSSATLIQEDFAKNAKPLPASPELWASQEIPRRCKLGESRGVAAAPQPDICAHLARITSMINAICGSDLYRMNELVRVAKAWQHATALKYASASRP